jgi:hypothetical protein
VLYKIVFISKSNILESTQTQQTILPKHSIVEQRSGHGNDQKEDTKNNVATAIIKKEEDTGRNPKIFSKKIRKATKQLLSRAKKAEAILQQEDMLGDLPAAIKSEEVTSSSAAVKQETREKATAIKQEGFAAVKQEIAAPDETVSSDVPTNRGTRATIKTENNSRNTGLPVMKKEETGIDSTRKRSAAPISGSLHTGSRQKRQKSERDHHHTEMSDNLRCAEQNARNGDREMMAYHLKVAAKHVGQAGALNDAFHTRVAAIRKSIGDECGHHHTEMSDNLRRAEQNARNGDREMMDYHLKVAAKHAGQAGALNNAFRRRVTAIRKSIGDESGYHHTEMSDNLRWAEQNARNGDREMMDYHLKVATKHAGQVGALDHAFHTRVAAIRKSMGDESSYHHTTMSDNLRRAEQNARNGDREMMDYHFKVATKHAGQAGALNYAFHTRVAAISNGLGSGIIKIE